MSFINLFLTIILELPFLICFIKNQFNFKSFILFFFSSINVFDTILFFKIISNLNNYTLWIFLTYIHYGIWIIINLKYNLK